MYVLQNKYKHINKYGTVTVHFKCIYCSQLECSLNKKVGMKKILEFCSRGYYKAEKMG